MRVCITTIPFTGMKIDAPIGLDAINQRLQEGGGEATFVFEEAPMADLTLTRTFGGIAISGKISGRCRQTCASCSDPVSHEISASIQWILQSDASMAGSDDSLDDPGVLQYEGDHIDLEDPLQEALILTMSPFWHPERDSSERCLVCSRGCSAKTWGSSEQSVGKQSSGSAPFGEMLKNALTKVPKQR